MLCKTVVFRIRLRLWILYFVSRSYFRHRQRTDGLKYWQVSHTFTRWCIRKIARFAKIYCIIEQKRYWTVPFGILFVIKHTSTPESVRRDRIEFFRTLTRAYLTYMFFNFHSQTGNITEMPGLNIIQPRYFFNALYFSRGSGTVKNRPLNRAEWDDCLRWTRDIVNREKI